MAKKMYHVHESFQNRDWIVLASNTEEAQEKIIEEFTDADDYPSDGEWEFEIKKCVCFELIAEVKVNMC